MARDKEKTRKRLIKALGDILARTGFGKVGINAIAREAGVDKVLIYRYFGGLQELLRAYAVHGDFWPSISELLDGKTDKLRNLADASVAILQGHLAQLRKRPVTQEIMRWELHDRNDLTEELARHREQQGVELMRLMDLGEIDGGDSGPDLAAGAAIIHAGLTYLVLRAKTADVYLGVDLTSEAGWQRLHNAVAELVQGYVGKLETE